MFAEIGTGHTVPFGLDFKKNIITINLFVIVQGDEHMKELDVVKLTRDFRGLPSGTKGTIVLAYDGKYFEVEYVNQSGDTIGVYTTPAEVLQLC
jgi:hypothetical protein